MNFSISIIFRAFAGAAVRSTSVRALTLSAAAGFIVSFALIYHAARAVAPALQMTEEQCQTLASQRGYRLASHSAHGFVRSCMQGKID